MNTRMNNQNLDVCALHMSPRRYFSHKMHLEGASKLYLCCSSFFMPI